MKKIILAVLAFCAFCLAEQIEILGSNDELGANIQKCEKGDSEACFQAGWLFSQFNSLDGAKDFYEKACNGKNFKGCTNLGALYFSGVDGLIKQDIKKAKELFVKACDLKDADGCNNAGYISETIEKDNKNAVKFYKKGCDLGHQGACGGYNELNK